jgi:hypothetical protein
MAVATIAKRSTSIGKVMPVLKRMTSMICPPKSKTVPKEKSNERNISGHKASPWSNASRSAMAKPSRRRSKPTRSSTSIRGSQSCGVSSRPVLSVKKITQRSAHQRAAMSCVSPLQSPGYYVTITSQIVRATWIEYAMLSDEVPGALTH